MSGSIVRVCFAFHILEGTLQILVSGLYRYFICVVSSSVRKSFLDSFEMTYLNYILDLQKKKNYVFILHAEHNMCQSVYVKHIMCPLYT